MMWSICLISGGQATATTATVPAVLVRMLSRCYTWWKWPAVTLQAACGQTLKTHLIFEPGGEQPHYHNDTYLSVAGELALLSSENWTESLLKAKVEGQLLHLIVSPAETCDLSCLPAAFIGKIVIQLVIVLSTRDHWYSGFNDILFFWLVLIVSIIGNAP